MDTIEARLFKMEAATRLLTKEVQELTASRNRLTRVVKLLLRERNQQINSRNRQARANAAADQALHEDSIWGD